MRLLKAVVLTLAALFAVLAVVGFFMDSRWYVERSIVIDAPPEVVYYFPSSAAGWEAWTAWAKEGDPSWKMTVESEVPAGVGARMRWDSEVYGTHTVAIEAAEPPGRVAYRMHLGAQDIDLEGEVRITPQGEGSQVTWSETGDIGDNPYARLMAGVMKGMVEGDFDKGLASLKRVAEARDAALDVEAERIAQEALRLAEEIEGQRVGDDGGDGGGGEEPQAAPAQEP